MLDPRIYRTGFVAVALAVVVVAFSLLDQQGPLTASLAPDAFNGQGAYSTMATLARNNPGRRPGSTGDEDVASFVSAKLRQYGYQVDKHLFSARTVDGKRTLETVTGVRTGSSTGSIVVLSHRDSLASPAAADLSGTAVLLELARVLAGETQHRTIILASTSGSAGQAGASELAQTISGHVDAVISLGDLAGLRARQPVLVPWSTGPQLASPVLRNTLAAALGAQAGLRPGGTSLGGQLAHLAFPLTLSEQGPFGARGVPAVSLSLAGDRPTAANEATSTDRINTLGRAVLQTINALDGGPGVPAASSYLLYSGKVVPGWAIRLLVLVLTLPVVLAVVDGFARVRRRGHSVILGLAQVLAVCVPFLLAVLVIVGARLVGALSATPPGPIAVGEVPLRGSGIAVMAVAALALLVSSWAMPRLVGALAGTPRSSSAEAGDPGRSIAVLVVLLLATLALWMLNPFAALLVIPALHLWPWLVDPETRPHPVLSALLLLIGVAPLVLVCLYWIGTQGLGPADALWHGALLIAGGQVGLLPAAAWSAILGCLVSVVVLAIRIQRQPRPEDAPVTVRGPVSYAGPGSLGGTESALRR
ncbi:MAG: hypothetical protein QOD66_2246 [Solirubrobacteraceae bacterium]|jgi:hypothetical protein|nr:hypothetical protein [Solirubrobacteraceae bacterium]